MLRARNFPDLMHILVVETRADRGKIILARTERSLLAVYKEHLAKDAGTEKKYFCGNIIDLPSHYADKFKADVFEQKRMNFINNLAFSVLMYYKDFHEFPPHTGPCSCVSLANVEDVFSVADIYCGDNDGRCLECLGRRFVLTDRSWDDLFFKKEPDWDKELPLAGATPESGTIYLASLDGGDHHRGAYIEKLPDIKDFRASLFVHILFAFVGDQFAVPEYIVEADSVHNQRQKELRLAKNDELDRRRLYMRIGDLRSLLTTLDCTTEEAEHILSGVEKNYVPKR